MQTHFLARLLFFCIFSLPLGIDISSASDYRGLTPEEKAKVSNALQKQGCSTPQSLKFDIETNLFEAEDAICQDNRKYDIYLDRNFKIVSMEPD